MDFVLIWFFFGIFSALIASNRNRSVFSWFLLGFLLGPIGLLFAFFMKDGKSLGEYKSFSLGRQKIKLETKNTEIDNKSIDSTTKLIKLSEMLDKGHITQAEFNLEKMKII